MDIKKQTLIWTGAAVLAILLMLEPVFGAVETGTANTMTMGDRQISSNDISGARQAAVSAALEQAVVNAFVQMVSPQVFAANLDILHTRILPKAQDYIATYRVLGEIAHENRYLVGVESKINLELLEQTLTDARIRNVGTDRPMILFLIAEKAPRDLLPRYWWRNNPEPYVSHAESKIVKIMAENRFKVVEMGSERPDPGFYDIRFQSIYDAKAAMDLAEKLHADLVVLGRASAAESANSMGDKKIFDAVIKLSAYDVSSGQQVAACENTADVKSDPDQEGAIQAIEKAADLAALELAEKLDHYWSGYLRTESHFDVKITGKGFLPRLIALKKRFAEMTEIENIQPKEIGSDQAVMGLVYKGTPSHFADSIMLKTFDGFGIEIAEVTDSLVKIRFIDDTGYLITDDLEVLEENTRKIPE